MPFENYITSADLDRYFEITKAVLGAPDPAIDLPEQERWLAQIKGKAREHTSRLRRSLAETLVLISVFSGWLTRTLGIDVAGRVSAVAHGLLGAADPHRWFHLRD